MKKLLLFMLFVTQLTYGQVSTTIQFKVNARTIIDNDNYAYFNHSVIPQMLNRDVEKVLVVK